MGGGDSLYDKIDRGMRCCKAVISCVTQKYSLSANCRREISLADALKKPVIPVLLEQMKWPPDGPMSMVFTELLYIDFSESEADQLAWTCGQFDELIGKLDQYVPDRKLKSESNESNTRPARKTRETSKDENNATNNLHTEKTNHENTTTKHVAMNDGRVYSNVSTVKPIISTSSKNDQSSKDATHASVKTETLRKNADSKFDKNRTADKKGKLRMVTEKADDRMDAAVKAKPMQDVNKQPSREKTGEGAKRNNSKTEFTERKEPSILAGNEPQDKHQTPRKAASGDLKSKSCTIL